MIAVVSAALLVVCGHLLAVGSALSTLGFGAQRLHQFRAVVGATSCANVTEHYFANAVIDNFAPIEQQQLWQGRGQRYWLNAQFWGGANFPIFVFIGGEGTESCTRLTERMYLFSLAQEHRALLVNVEHRFYGESMPLPDSSVGSLAYLSSSQALADLARIIPFIKKSLHSESSIVITVGGSYPGNLAAWFRLKYPAISHGSIASSAPVRAQVNFPEYMDVVGMALIHFAGQPCFNAMKDAADQVAALAQQGVGSAGLKQLETDFALCQPISSDLDLAVFLSDLMGNVQGTIQYNNEKYNVMNATDICATMTSSEDAYSNFVKLQAAYRQANGQSCEDGNWADTVQALRETGAARSWTYQTCNEFGYYQTTDSEVQPFHSWTWINLNFSRAICSAAFDGWQSDPEVGWINDNYGSLAIGSTNTVFPSGTIDPWHALGVTNSTAPLPERSDVKVFIEGTAHCNDLYAPASSDPSSLIAARKVIADNVRLWLHKAKPFPGDAGY